VKKIELIYIVKHPCSTWKIYSCIWSIPVICGWENLSWKSIPVQTVPKTSSLPMVVHQTVVWRFNRILSIKHKKKIYTFLNSYLKRLRKSNEINYVKKKWTHIYCQRSLLDLKDLFLQMKHSDHLWLRKSIMKIFTGANGAQD